MEDAINSAQNKFGSVHLSQSVQVLDLQKCCRAPYNDLEADLVLESSDEVHFYFIKKTPYSRRRRSSLPGSAPSRLHIKNLMASESFPHWQLAPFFEPSTILDLALRHMHIYPVRTSKTDTLHNASILAEFARIYKAEALDNVIAGYLTGSVERNCQRLFHRHYIWIQEHLDKSCPVMSNFQSFILHICNALRRLVSIFRNFSGILLHVGRLPAPFHHHTGHGFVVAFPGIFGPKGASGNTVACPSCPAPDLIKSGFYITWWT